MTTGCRTLPRKGVEVRPRECFPGFTLIELLVVIGIIAILAGILMPAISSISLKGQKVQARGDAKRILAAWKSYYNEYGRWPANAGEGASAGMPMNAYFVQVLAARYFEDLQDNPKRIVFIEFAADQLTSTTNVVDPWGTPYRVLFDTNYNGRVERNGFSDVYDSVLVWSAGPDTNTSTTAEAKDDLNSWD